MYTHKMFHQYDKKYYFMNTFSFTPYSIRTSKSTRPFLSSFNKINILKKIKSPYSIKNNTVVKAVEVSETKDMICVPYDVYVHDAVQLIFLGIYMSILVYNMYFLVKRSSR